LGQTNHITPDVLIVGAGLSGLMAAQEFKNMGLTAAILEAKERPGGRISTRQVGPGRADSGAQFFTMRSQRFEEIVKHWMMSRLVYTWSTGWYVNGRSIGTGQLYPRFAVRGGMQTLADTLALGLDIQLNSRVRSVHAAPEGWLTEDEAGRVYRSRALLLTPPVPESLKLIDGGKVPLDVADRKSLEQIHYEPCLCGLFRLNGPSALPRPGAVQQPGQPVTWMADNRQKGISDEATVVTVHASPTTSRSLWDAPDEEIEAVLLEALKPYLPDGARVEEVVIERWPHALPDVTLSERMLLATGLPPLAFAGDAFGGPRIEGAVLSGLAAAEALGEQLVAARSPAQD
jgi:renalase